jgi:DNA polymerase III delta prime subunit
MYAKIYISKTNKTFFLMYCNNYQYIIKHKLQIKSNCAKVLYKNQTSYLKNNNSMQYFIPKSIPE